MQRSIKHNYAMKLYVTLEKLTVYTLVVIQQVFESESLSKASIFFKIAQVLRRQAREYGRRTPRGGPSTSRNEDIVQRVRDVVTSHQRLSVQMIAYNTGIDKMTVFTIITENVQMHQGLPQSFDRRQKAKHFACLRKPFAAFQTNPQCVKQCNNRRRSVITTPRQID
ncbi:hypothetical protein NPIL_368591 [Nephila pilipes]|uniref:Uncharacterized protein n=1 Tax=Nephila pilipes TaxID=299642 RepID=A0A8X6NKP9_NEPPI|nr:hypothetical protein NPIL_368591 [Nephila pilipes]